MLAFRPEGSQPATARAAPGAMKPKPAEGDWPALARQLPLSGGAKELARNAELQSREGNVFNLVVPKSMAHLAGESFRDKLQAALSTHLGGKAQVCVAQGEVSGPTAAAQDAAENGARHAEAVRAVQNDSLVQDLVNLFGGRVVDSTIREKQP